MNQTPIKPPDVISTQKSKIPPMDPNKLTTLGASNTNNGVNLGTNAGRVTDSQGTGQLATTGNDKPPVENEDAPPPPKKVVPKIVSGGVLNGKATSLPKPAYPAAARAIHASGAVVVQVTIDEGGRVISASAVSGHPLLKAAAVSAAQGARFSPTLLSGQAVKVSGVITYNFTAQ
jgi:TonB family protein